MAIPKKWSQLDGQLNDTLSLKQFSANFDIYYHMVNHMVIHRRITFIKKCEKWVKFSTLIRLISRLLLDI